MELVRDAEAVLKAFLGRRAKRPTINAIVMEIQLVLGATMQDMWATHVWSEKNEVADELSRWQPGMFLPEALDIATETATNRPVFKFLGEKNRQTQRLQRRPARGRARAG